MRAASAFKGVGYLLSSLSVVLLGIVGWKSASEQPLLFACLIAGMLASVAGMALRWVSHRIDEKDKDAIAREAEGAGYSGLARGGHPH